MGNISVGNINPIIPSNRVQQRLERLRQLVPSSKKKRMYVSEFPDKSFQQWHSVDCSRIDRSGNHTLIQGSVNHFMIWCEENCSGKYVLYRKIIWFEKEEDATFFLMVWG
jgi:hypothetical protein